MKTRFQLTKTMDHSSRPFIRPCDGRDQSVNKITVGDASHGGGLPSRPLIVKFQPLSFCHRPPNSESMGQCSGFAGQGVDITTECG